MVAAQVLVEAGGPRGEPGDAEVPSRLHGQHSRAVDPVREAARVDQEGHERLEVGLQPADVGRQLLAARGREVRLHSADGHRPPQETRPEEPFLQRDEALAQELGVRGGDGERHVGGDRADVRDVVVDALQLEQHDAQGPRARRRLAAGQPLDRVAEGGRVAQRGIAGDALGQEDAVTPRQALEELLRALVRVEEAELQVEDRLAGDAEEEVAGLDDAGVHRPHRHLEDAFAGHRAEGVERALGTRGTLVVGKVLAQRVHVGPVVVQRDPAGVGVAFGDEAEHVLHLALEPVGRRVLRRDGRKVGVGGVDTGRDAQEGPVVRQEPDVVERVDRVPRAVVGGEEGGEPRAGAGHQAVRRFAKHARLDVGPQLAGARRADGGRWEGQGLGDGLDHGVHAPSTTRTAARTRAMSGPGR